MGTKGIGRRQHQESFRNHNILNHNNIVPELLKRIKKKPVKIEFFQYLRNKHYTDKTL